MKILDSYIIKSFLRLFLLAFIIAFFLLFMQKLWLYIDDLVGKGLKFNLILELVSYVSASLIRLSIVLAILLSSIMTFGKLGENFELTAIKSSGISLFRLMRPLIILIVFVCIGAFYFANYVETRSHLKLISLINDIQKQQPEFNLDEGVFYNGIEYHRKFTISIACLLFFLIGAPLGGIIRKGGLGMPVIVSIFFFLLYYILSVLGEKYVKIGVLPSFEGMWLSSFILIPIGIFLTNKATIESGIMTVDNYLLFFRKIISVKRKR